MNLTLPFKRKSCLFLLLSAALSIFHYSIHAQQQKSKPKQPELPVLKPAVQVVDPEAASAAYQATLPPKPLKDDTEKFYSSVDEMPDPGYNLGTYLSENLRYPENELRNHKGGRVVLQFVVSKTGEIQNVVITQSLSPDFDAEALRLVKAMPTWKRPGMLQGKPIPIYYTLPITFYGDRR